MFDNIPFREMSAINQFAVKNRDMMLDSFSKNEYILKSYVEQERQIKADYAERELLELIQNADDAATEGEMEGGKIKIQLRGNVLSFYNDGKEFSEKGILSLLVPYNSSKSRDGSTIGNKGLGFRALLNKAEYIRVESRGLSIRFGRKDNEVYYAKYNEYDLRMRPPVMNTLRVVSPMGTDGYTTMVRVKLRDENAVRHIERLIREINVETLLFLQKDTEILISINGEEYKYVKTLDGINCTISTICDGNTVSKSRYKVVHKTYKTMVENDDGSREEKKAKIAIAWPMDEGSWRDYRTMYSYLRTDIQFPTNWLIHANFDLLTNRSGLVKSEYNWSLMTNIVDLIFKCATSATRNNSQWKACGYVLGNYDKFDDDIKYDGQTIEDYFIEKLKSAKILPTVNDEFISFNDGPFHYRSRLSDYLCGGSFKLLLKYATEPQYDEFVEEYGSKRYNHAFLKAEIDDILSKGMDLSKIIGFSIVYKDEFKDKGLDPDVIPNFFHGKVHRFIPANYTKFTEPTREVFRDLPDYLEFDFVQNDVLKEIRAQLDVSSNEDLVKSDYASFYGIRQYRLETVAREYYKALCERGAVSSEWIDFVRWCFRNDVAEQRDLLGDFHFMIPTQSGQLVEADDAYLTGDYGYDLVESIWPDCDSLICDYDAFGLGENEKADFVKFLRATGVMERPRKNVNGSIDGLAEILKTKDVSTVQELLLDDELDLWSSSEAKNIINTTAWIEIGDRKYEPRQIILDKVYKQDYDGIVGISRERLIDLLGEKLADLLMVKVTLRTRITEFSEEIIYGVLLALPERDPEGDLAKVIQRQLAELESEVVDEIAGIFADDTYEEFLKNGQVFCRDGKYHPIAETYYLADGTLSSVMTEDRNLIDVPRKKGAEKIEELFGVKKLTVEYSIKNFKKSGLDMGWQEDWRNRKAGIATKIDNAVDKMKGMRVALCDSVRIEMQGEDGEIVKKLNEYDFAVGKDGKYYVVIPHDDMEEIKYDPDFVECITEIVVMRLGTDSAEESRDSIKVVLQSHNIQKEFSRDEELSSRWDEMNMELFGGDEYDKNKLIEKNYAEANRAKMLLEEQYRMSLYDALLNSGIEQQIGYSVKVYEYKNWQVNRDDEELTRADFEAEDYIKRKLFDGLDFSAKNNYGNEYYTKFCKELSENERIILVNDAEIKDLVRFGRLPEARQLIEKRPRKADEQVDEVDVPAEEIKLRREDEVRVEQLVNKPKVDYKRSGRVGGGAYVFSENREKRKHENAKRAVKLTIEYLEREYKCKVKNVTGDSLLDGENIDGDDSAGYDLEYTLDGVRHLVEVKSCKQKNEASFTITKNEYEVAEEKSKIEGVEYEVICIVGIESKNPYPVFCKWEDLKPDLISNEYYYSKSVSR